MKKILSALLFLALTPAASMAEAPADPCGGLKFESGRITTGLAMAVEPTLSAASDACVNEIAKQVLARPAIRAVTVVARATDADRGKGLGLAPAQAVVEKLVSQGLPRARVSAVAPRFDEGDRAGLSFTYAEAPFSRGVGAILRATDTNTGRGEELKPGAAGDQFKVHDVLRTGASGSALVRLSEGSTLLLGPSTTLRIEALNLNDKGKRQVQLELLAGDLEVDAASTAGGEGSVFEISSATASTHVIGTRFRIGATRDATRVETLEGTVYLSASGKEIEVKAGQGGRATDKVDGPRALLAGPVIEEPTLGTFSKSPSLKWKVSEGAASYQVELARNADFNDGLRRVPAPVLTLAVDNLDTGKWFWRVLPIDADGIEGLPSKIYALTLDPSYLPPVKLPGSTTLKADKK